jgi:hypothetical protein
VPPDPAKVKSLVNSFFVFSGVPLDTFLMLHQDLHRSCLMELSIVGSTGP